MQMRLLERNEVERVWEVDRSEIIQHVYLMRDGEMVLTPRYFDVKGWRSAPTEADTAFLHEIFDRGGAFIALFDGDKIAGIAVADNLFFGENGDFLELKKLYVSKDYRQQGVGTRLFEAAKTVAKERGAKTLYVSATPTENTVNFYLARGCRLALPPDATRLALEPEDIHLHSAL